MSENIYYSLRSGIIKTILTLLSILLVTQSSASIRCDWLKLKVDEASFKAMTLEKSSKVAYCEQGMKLIKYADNYIMECDKKSSLDMQNAADKIANIKLAIEEKCKNSESIFPKQADSNSLDTQNLSSPTKSTGLEKRADVEEKAILKKDENKQSLSPAIINHYHPKSEPKQLYIVEFIYEGIPKTYRVYCPTGMVRDISNGKWKKARKAYSEDRLKYGNGNVIRGVMNTICGH